jgi:hypothetical protein
MRWQPLDYMTSLIPALLGARRARRQTVRLIGQLVEESRTRLGGIADSTWLEPYMIGFMSALITVIIHEQIGRDRLGEQLLGLVQADCWARITGLPGDRIGEEICLLSLNNDEAFCLGCSSALAYVASRAPRDAVVADPDAAIEAPLPSPLWRDHFEAHVA